MGADQSESDQIKPFEGWIFQYFPLFPIKVVSRDRPSRKTTVDKSTRRGAKEKLVAVKKKDAAGKELQGSE